MFHLDNGSGVRTMPPLPEVLSPDAQWFTESPPSYPGAHWYNIVQGELLNLVNNAGASPNKQKLTQVYDAVASMVKTSGFHYSAVTLLKSSELTIADFGSRIRLDGTSPNTVILPDSKAITDSGQTISIWNNKTTAVTISVANTGSEFISLGTTSPSTVTLNPTESITFIVARAGGWHATGDGVLKYSNLFASTIALNGWQKLPSGLITQWGTTYVDGNGDAVINFPIAFTSACHSITALSGSNTHAVYAPSSMTNITAVLPFYKTDSGIKSPGGFNCIWQAIGK